MRSKGMKKPSFPFSWLMKNITLRSRGASPFLSLQQRLGFFISILILVEQPDCSGSPTSYASYNIVVSRCANRARSSRAVSSTDAASPAQGGRLLDAVGNG